MGKLPKNPKIQRFFGIPLLFTTIWWFSPFLGRKARNNFAVHDSEVGDWETSRPCWDRFGSPLRHEDGKVHWQTINTLKVIFKYNVQITSNSLRHTVIIQDVRVGVRVCVCVPKVEDWWIECLIQCCSILNLVACSAIKLVYHCPISIYIYIYVTIYCNAIVSRSRDTPKLRVFQTKFSQKGTNFPLCQGASNSSRAWWKFTTNSCVTNRSDENFHGLFHYKVGP